MKDNMKEGEQLEFETMIKVEDIFLKVIKKFQNVRNSVVDNYKV